MPSMAVSMLGTKFLARPGLGAGERQEAFRTRMGHGQMAKVRQRLAAGQRQCLGARRFDQGFARRQGLDELGAFEAAGGLERPRDDQRRGALQAQRARQQLRAARARHQPQRGFWQPDGRLGHGDPRVAPQRQLQAAADGPAIERRHHRLAHAEQKRQHAGVERGMAQGAAGVEFGEVGPGAEDAVRARQDHTLDRWVALGLLEGGHERAAQGHGHGVDGAVVHREKKNAVGAESLLDGHRE